MSNEDFHRLPVEFTAELVQQLEDALVKIGIWETANLHIGDYRINDLTEGLRKAAKAARHLRDGINYPEQIAARKNLLSSLGYPPEEIAEAKAGKATIATAQIRRGTLPWETVGTNEDPHKAAELLAIDMQKNGLRYSELYGKQGHLADLENGFVLSADNGVSFRVVRAGEDLTDGE